MISKPTIGTLILKLSIVLELTSPIIPTDFLLTRISAVFPFEKEAIIQQLKGLEGVMEVHGTFGAYDILAKIESDTVEKLRETITWKIRKIEKIRSTLTLMGIECQV